MKLDDYIGKCKQFAKDTKKWAALDEYKCYTTSPIDGWEETPDNAHGGIDVSWAFHMKAADIQKQAPQKFVDLLIDELYLMDEPLYYEDMEKIAEKYN